MAVTTNPTGLARAALLVVCLAGCPTPAQEGGLVRIDTEGFARRLELLCSSGHADPSCAPAVDASVVEEAGDAAAEEAGE
jgi:hypothetical protein